MAVSVSSSGMAVAVGVEVGMAVALMRRLSTILCSTSLPWFKAPAVPWTRTRTTLFPANCAARNSPVAPGPWALSGMLYEKMNPVSLTIVLGATSLNLAPLVDGALCLKLSLMDFRASWGVVGAVAPLWPPNKLASVSIQTRISTVGFCGSPRTKLYIAGLLRSLFFHDLGRRISTTSLGALKVVAVVRSKALGSGVEVGAGVKVGKAVGVALPWSCGRKRIASSTMATASTTSSTMVSRREAVEPSVFPPDS